MSTHLDNVLMQQSYGPKRTMPTQRETGELLLALNEFNKYELFTGTGTGVQPLFSDGYGSSNISFTVNQDSADALNGKFVYFDNATNTWKPAYASATPSTGDHFTAQGFAISLNSTGLQVTTSGKLVIPFRLTDYTGASVVAGSYYYLCQTEANAGLIQQNAPASGIMQVVCQVISVDDTSTTLLLLNDLSQVANDIIVTDGDGSKYLGDDGQYHDMMVAGLAGRTSNCLDTYEVLDINFENIAAGRSAATAYTFPTLTANGAWDDSNIAAIGAAGYAGDTVITVSPTTIFNITAGTNNVWTFTGSENTTIGFKYPQPTYLTSLIIKNHTDAAQANNNINTFVLTYQDTADKGGYGTTNYTITVPTNTAGAQYIHEIPIELSKEWGAHKIWSLEQITTFAGETTPVATNLIRPSGYYYTDAAGTPSYGYIANGDITIQDGVATGWSSSNYIISKYLVENYSQWSYRVRKTFEQVTNEDPIWQSPNKQNYLAIENGALKLVLNGLSYKGNLVYEANKPYDFKINYNISSGYVISVSSDNSDNPTWTNEIILYDEVNYMDGTTWMLGVASLGDDFIVGSGSIDLNYSGMDYINNERSFDTYPLTDLTTKSIAAITVTFKGTGLVAQGRAASTTTLNAQAVDVDTVENTIIASDGTDLLWDTTKGLTIANYTETDYLRQYEDEEQNTVLYAKDTNLCYSYTIVYPNFLQTNVEFDTQNNVTKLDLSGTGATFHPNTFLNRNGFNFNLKLDATGALRLDRVLDARNYGSSQSHPFYYAVQGVDWSTFQTDGSFVQGIKLSSALGSTNTGTANNSLYQLTVNDANYADSSYGSQNSAAPSFFYFAFEKPIKFSSITFRNFSDANYIPTQYCMHVSNDMNNWYSIMPTTATGYVANGMFGNMPIDAYATYPNRTGNAIFNVSCTMPDENQYYKYVRIGVAPVAAYRAILCGCWIGMNYVSAISETGATQTAYELIFEDTNFINTDTSGINAQVIRKKVGTAYQVRFLDKLGYVEAPPETGVTDITGKVLAPNDEQVYSDSRLQLELEPQRLAYQTRCKRFLRDEKSYSYGNAFNPFQTINNTNGVVLTYSASANTGTVANSYTLIDSNTTTYDFANGLLESSFVITFLNRARVGHFYIQNHTAAAYSVQQIKVYGAVNGGSYPGCTTFGDGEPGPETEWEEIPITKIINAYNNGDLEHGDFEHYAPTNEMNTTVAIANNTNDMTGPIKIGNYGAFIMHIAPKKAYQQYRITVQRTTNNRVIQMQIMPKDIWYDPFATQMNAGENMPLLVDAIRYPSSTISVLPDKNSITQGIYASPYSPTTVCQLYITADNSNWTPENSRRYVYLQQVYPYAVNMNSIMIQHGTDLNYATNLFEYYGTNLTSLGTTALSNTNSLRSWSRITSLMDKSDIPTAISTAQTQTNLLLGNKEYGYTYFTALFRRSINNQIYMSGFKPSWIIPEAYTNVTTYLNMSKYVEEWKWTNVAGDAGEVRNAACYNHPLLQTGDTISLEPSYEVKKREDDTSYYTSIEGTKDSYVPDKTKVYTTTSLIENSATTPYESRWMYKFLDAEGEAWYCNTAATGTAGTVGSFMYKNIIPKYNTEVYTGIPLNATANEGSENGYTYFASSEYDTNTYQAWNAFSQTSTTTWAGATGSYDMTTGLPTADAQYVGFISPTPLTIQGYTIGARSTNPSNPSKWKFQGSNDGDIWEDIDTRDTTLEENPDTPLNPDAGTTYYFNNEKPYTQFRWLIEQVTPGATNDSYGIFKCKGLFVLEENPVEVHSIFELTYTDHELVQHTAYTATTGSSGQFVTNNTTIYTDVNLVNPITNEWAYQVSDGSNTYYTKVAGDSGTYAPETTMIYEDQDFSVEFGEALVDTWQYTGVINKKYAYNGTQLNNFTWDGEEPYNKYFYTGNVANQFKYTGKIEGWTYTGVSEDIYDTVPNFHLSLNRDDVRKIQKATLLGVAYPVTNSSNLSGVSYYSFTNGDVAGTIVPEGTPLYASIDATEPSASADGTNNYVFSSAPTQSRYTYEYLYVVNNDLPDGQNLTGDEQAYQDANLTTPASEDTNLTEYTYTSEREASHMHDFYHRITETTPVENYNFGLSFDGSKYTYTNYVDDGTTDIQEYQNGELIKGSYQGPDASVRNNSVIMMTQQNLLKLNLSASTYSWWTWNNLTSPSTTKTTSSIFRLAQIDGSASSIDNIYELYPWRVGEGSGNSHIYQITNEGKAKNINSLYIAQNDLTLAELPDRFNNKVIMRQAIPVAPLVLNVNSSGTSFTSTIGAYVEVRSPGNLTLYAGSGGDVTFTGFVGCMYIPPACNVRCTTTMYYKVF